MNPPAYIVGNGGHAHVIRSLLPHRRIRFLVDRHPGADDLLQDDFLADPDLDADYYVGIGDNVVRRRYFDILKRAGLRIPPCVAPTAWIAADAMVGDGSFIGSGAIVGARSKVGENAIVNTFSSVEHDCQVGDDSQLAPAVVLGGGVRIGRNCFLGMRACVLPRVAIGDDVTVLAGALVSKTFGPGLKIGGTPARTISAAGTSPSN